MPNLEPLEGGGPPCLTKYPSPLYIILHPKTRFRVLQNTPPMTQALGNALAGSGISREDLSDRIRQELTMHGMRADVAEEMDRLGAHVAEVRRTLDAGGGVGRRLDFLMQELNREANTIASKASAIEMTTAAVELKLLIEQMREQVQNLE